jgi:hypothetical protein
MSVRDCCAHHGEGEVTEKKFIPLGALVVIVFIVAEVFGRCSERLTAKAPRTQRRKTPAYF